MFKSINAVFISTPQAVGRLEPLKDSVAERVQAILPQSSRPETLQVGAVSLRVFSLHHGRASATQNLAFEIDLGGRKVLHVGDTEVNAGEIEPLHLGEANIDLALLPPWVLAKEDLVRQALRPRRLGLMHVPARDAPPSYFGQPGNVEGLVEALREMYPELLTFLEPGDTVSIVAE